MVFVVHGEDKVTEIFADTLHDELGLNAYAPFSGTEYDLLAQEFVREAKGVPYIKKVKTPAERISAVFARLLGAGERLMQVIRKNEHGANKDLAKFTSQINALCDKWDK